MNPALPATPYLFDALSDLIPTGSILYTPVRDAGGAVVDFAFSRLNPAARALLKLPVQVAQTYTAHATGAFDSHLGAFESEEPRHFKQPHQADGHGHYLRMAARRVGERRLVRFTNGTDQRHAAAAEARYQSQAQERAQLTASNAEYETVNTALRKKQQQLQLLNVAQQDLLEQILRQVPAAIATLNGPEHRYSFFDERTYQGLSANFIELDLPVADVFPEVVAPGFVDLLDQEHRDPARPAQVWL